MFVRTVRNVVILRLGKARGIWRSGPNFVGHRDRCNIHKGGTVSGKPGRMGSIDLGEIRSKESAHAVQHLQVS